MISTRCFENRIFDIISAKLIYAAPLAADRNEKCCTESSVIPDCMVQSGPNGSTYPNVIYAAGRLRSIAPT